MSFIAKLLTVIVVCGFVSVSATRADDRDFFVTNDTNYDVTGLWTSQKSVTKWIWVANFKKIPPGETFAVSMLPLPRSPDNCILQMQFEIAGHGKWYYLDGFDICVNSNLRVYYNPGTDKYGMEPR